MKAHTASPHTPVRVGIKSFDKFIERYHTDHPSLVELRTSRDPASVLSAALERAGMGTRNATDLLECIHLNPGFGFVDVYHLSNTLTISRKPWVALFEHYLPRWNCESEKGMAMLARRQCRRLVAMSQYAKKTQASKLRRFPAIEETVMKKVVVVPPGQKILVSPSRVRSRDSEELMFTFVGGDFFRKGGREILQAFDALIREGEKVRLTIISTLDTGDYASRSTPRDAEWALGMMRGMGRNVTYQPSLAHREVLDLFLRSDVSLLPTYHDTYGFSLLESQAAGCPVISTDCCALSEINDNDIGWMIRVPIDTLGDPHIETAEQRAAFSKTVSEGVYATVKEICRNPDAIPAKGALALRRISRMHDTTRIRDAIEAICIDAARGISAPD